MTTPSKTVKVLVDREKGPSPPPLEQDVEFLTEIRACILSMNAIIVRKIEKLKQQ